MRNLFQEGTYQAGLGAVVPQGGAFRPMKMGQLVNQAPSGMVADRSIMPTDQRVIKPVSDLKPVPVPPVAEKPGIKLSPRRDRFQWAVDRLCAMMRRFGNTRANPQAVSRVFWAFVKHAKSSEEAVLTAYKTACRDLPVPEKPVKRIPEKPSVKVPVTYQEAVQIKEELDKAMESVTVEEVVERADAESSGALAPEDLPKAEILQEELSAFVSAGDTGATLSIDQEEAAVADKAIEQASEIRTEKTTKGLLTAAGVVGAGALLVYLL